jgi:hypothetical protein
MAMDFRYRSATRPDGTSVVAPLIPVTFHGSRRIKTLALLDSGADISALPKQVAELIGVDIDGKVCRSYGVGGSVESVGSWAGVTVSKGHERYTFRLPVRGVMGAYDLPPILGRHGFFDRFSITFDQAQERVSLKRVVKR